MFTDSILIFLGFLFIALFVCFLAFIMWLYVNYPFLLFVFIVSFFVIYLLFNYIKSEPK